MHSLDDVELIKETVGRDSSRTAGIGGWTGKRMRIDAQKDAKRQLGQGHGRGKAARWLRPKNQIERERDTRV